MRTMFVSLFLKGKADKMPPIQALSRFYDFIDLTQIGPDGDEMIRRMSDGGANYTAAHNTAGGTVVIGGLSDSIIRLHVFILYAAVGLGIAQIPFIINFFWSIRHGKPAGSDNPWHSTTLEWQTPTPPPQV